MGTNLRLTRGADWSFTVVEAGRDWNAVTSFQMQIRDRRGTLLADISDDVAVDGAALAIQVGYEVTDTWDWGTAYYTLTATTGDAREVILSGKVTAERAEVRVPEVTP